MLRFQTDEIAAVAEHDVRFEWQLPQQFSTEPCSRSRFAHYKRAGSTHIHDIIVTQVSCEDAWPKRPVPPNIDTPEENNESHTVPKLLAERLETVRELRTSVTLVRELCDEQRKRFGVTGDP